ncbi:MAG TPA: DUF1697 domain-containing protein [Propionicimonas sp.]
MTSGSGQAAAQGRRVALLRGINVGGARKVPMADLRDVATSLGWTDVATHLQSGNLLFTAQGSDVELSKTLSAALKERFSMHIDVVVRTGEEVRRLVSGHPFADGDPAHVVIACCDRPVSEAAADKLTRLAADGERLQVVGADIYADFPDGQARSKLATQLVSALKPATGTARNLRTMTKLAEMLS